MKLDGAFPQEIDFCDINTCCLRDLEYIRDSQGVYLLGVNSSKLYMLNKGTSHIKKRYKKGTLSVRGGGSTTVPFLSPNLPDSQITQKWTFDTTI